MQTFYLLPRRLLAACRHFRPPRPLRRRPAQRRPFYQPATRSETHCLQHYGIQHGPLVLYTTSDALLPPASSSTTSNTACPPLRQLRCPIFGIPSWIFPLENRSTGGQRGKHGALTAASPSLRQLTCEAERVSGTLPPQHRSGLWQATCVLPTVLIGVSALCVWLGQNSRWSRKVTRVIEAGRHMYMLGLRCCR